jgi:flagellar biosynthetic protein FlhB
MSGQDDDSEKSFDPTPQKLEEARKKGEIPRSQDISTAAAYAGFLVAALAVGGYAMTQTASGLMTFLDQPERLAPRLFSGTSSAVTSQTVLASVSHLAPWIAVPGLSVLLAILAQRSFLVTGSKLKPKLSRISLISNAKNKFGRSGLFEFFKSFVKLCIYSVLVGVFLNSRLEEIIALPNANMQLAISTLLGLLVQFLAIVLAIALAIGFVDLTWQHAEHHRKNMMSRKEIMDEMKNTEGDPQMKNQRRQRGYEIAMSQMMVDVEKANVVVVNPTHYAVALTWSRLPGEAPVCVAKGVDEIAGKIREVAQQHGVPIHSDPPTARAIHAATDIGQEIEPDHYRAVAAAIRFAEAMRTKARARGL